MLFASFDFLLFFFVVFSVYWALRRHAAARTAWIVAASLFFYMASSKPVDGPLPTPWYFVGLLILSTVTDYVCGIAIGRARERAWRRSSPSAGTTSIPETFRAGRPWLIASVIINLGLLGYFKYVGFFLEVITDVAAHIGIALHQPTWNVLLPIGISFYTFQSLSYTIDVYRGQLAPERSLLRFMFFVSFFPQLVAGPIVRAKEFLPQMRERVPLTVEQVNFAAWRITKGLLKKVVLGDFIAVAFADRVFAAPVQHSSLENLLALYAFTLQIYADFSGYSDIAIGVARLFGFQLPENFRRPYQAVSVADFWRRWHMTLSTWLRDYLYYPLGGSRLGEARTYINLWITMFLVGLWHGASWNFVIYAFLQAGAMLFNRACRKLSAGTNAWRPRVKRIAILTVLVTATVAFLGRVALAITNPWPLACAAGGLAFIITLLPPAGSSRAATAVHVLLTVHFSVLSRVFFRAETLDSAREMVTKLLQWDGLGMRDGLMRIEGLATWLAARESLRWLVPVANQGILVLLILGFAIHYVPSDWVESTAQKLTAKAPAIVVGMSVAVVVGLLGLVLSGPKANIYFAF